MQASACSGTAHSTTRTTAHGSRRAWHPLATGGLYVNFMAAEDSGAAAARPPVYGTRAGERLAALKRRYDPENVFRLNHNIAP